MENSKTTDRVEITENPVLIKSKHRVRKHGEVFTPQWVIDKMMTIPGIQEKAVDIFATFLEPSAGEGAFLLAIQDMKLRFVTNNHGEATWGPYALWALSSIYGIEFLEDNLSVARQNMLDLFSDYYEDVFNTQISEQSDIYKSAQTIIWANVVQGDTLTRKNLQGKDITFSHWDRVPHEPRKVRRTPFTYSSLFPDDESEARGTQLTLFEEAQPTGTQLQLFDVAEQGDFSVAANDGKESDPLAQSYAIVDIELVWGEEKTNVR